MKNPIIKRVILILLLALSTLNICAQNKVDTMRARARKMQQEIADKEKILLSSQNDLRSKMQNLDLLTAQIKERKALITMLRNELNAIDDSISVIDNEIKRNKIMVDSARAEYARSLRIARHYGSLKNKLLFIVSADNFNTMVRRYRYVQEYMNAHRTMADKLKAQLMTLEAQKALADSVRAEKAQTFALQDTEQKELQRLEGEQRRLVNDLRRQSNAVKKELQKQRNRLAAINKEIDRQIEMELDRRRKAKAVAKKKSAKASNTAPVARNNEEVTRMNGSFLQNKGKLPPPLTGPYHVVSGFGLQNGVTGKGQVMVDNKGIILQGEDGAKARCIFDGEVIVVFQRDDYALVIVEHGKYMSVYGQLDKIDVKKGDKVNAGTILGNIAKDASGHTRMLFQLCVGRNKVNPASWLKL
ncbi:MAG: peptidoglycan DD-metalloendopeptidase family protein [Bacteroidaceae bacterium]|nr:peptidoglycan DD-metalloendopeptidase family protein [Bacteroidaceae bacterium]